MESQTYLLRYMGRQSYISGYLKYVAIKLIWICHTFFGYSKYVITKLIWVCITQNKCYPYTYTGNKYMLFKMTNNLRTHP